LPQKKHLEQDFNLCSGYFVPEEQQALPPQQRTAEKSYRPLLKIASKVPMTKWGALGLFCLSSPNATTTSHLSCISVEDSA